MRFGDRHFAEVGDEYLEEQPNRQQLQAEQRVRLEHRRLAQRLQLIAQIRIAHDRSGDQMREERGEAHEAQQVALGLDLPVGDVDGVGDELERVEADAGRQQDTEEEPEMVANLRAGAAPCPR